MIKPDQLSEINLDLWQEWIDYRQQDLKKPASDRSLKMTLKKLEALSIEGYDPNKLIELAIEREWRGIFKHDDAKRDQQNSQQQPRSAAERVRANAQRNHVRVVGGTG